MGPNAFTIRAGIGHSRYGFPSSIHSKRSTRQRQDLLLQQRLRLLQIARVKAFSEPPLNRSKQFARLVHLTLVAPEACEAHCGAEVPGFGLLLARDRECALEMHLGLL